MRNSDLGLLSEGMAVIPVPGAWVLGSSISPEADEPQGSCNHEAWKGRNSRVMARPGMVFHLDGEPL